MEGRIAVTNAFSSLLKIPVAHAARVRFCGKTTHASRVRHIFNGLLKPGLQRRTLGPNSLLKDE